MKKLLFILCFSCSLQANSQPFTISFSGAGLSTVKVQNLTTGAIVDIPSGDALLLSVSTGMPEDENLKSKGLKIYPNPMSDESTLEILPPVEGLVDISVSDISGKVMTQLHSHFGRSLQQFRLSGIRAGIYIVTVKGNGFQLSGKLLSNCISEGPSFILSLNNKYQVIPGKKPKKESKGGQATVDMAYNPGDRLKYTAVSGNNSTVLTDIPVSDKTVTFTFTECRDGDNNFYPVVQVNTQLWMAENLKTTRYNDGTTIPNILDHTSWETLLTGAYADYGNNPVNSSIYGRLYNWYTVDNNVSTREVSNGGKNVCPAGWHVPGDAEWVTLITYLSGESVAGGKLKETGTAHWLSPNTDAANETGFTAMPGGLRFMNSLYNYLGSKCNMWSSAEYSGTSASYRVIYFNYSNLIYGTAEKQTGFSVRCVSD